MSDQDRVFACHVCGRIYVMRCGFHSSERAGLLLTDSAGRTHEIPTSACTTHTPAEVRQAYNAGPSRQARERAQSEYVQFKAVTP